MTCREVGKRSWWVVVVGNFGRAGEALGDGQRGEQLLGEPGVEKEVVVWPGNLLTTSTCTVGGRQPWVSGTLYVVMCPPLLFSLGSQVSALLGSSLPSLVLLLSILSLTSPLMASMSLLGKTE